MADSTTIKFHFAMKSEGHAVEGILIGENTAVYLLQTACLRAFMVATY